jgi:crooked neck
METSRGPPRVKNKAAAPVQISAEQLLREAVDRQEVALQAPTLRFEDLEELHEYQGRKRQEFEEYVRRNRQNLNNWLRYAQWELDQKEFARARSVFERALDVHPNSPPLWMRYSEAEMKNRNVNHARNVLDRAVTRLPRCDKIWYRYVYMEEMLGNIAGTRQVFARWMEWRPDEAAWSSYIKLEKRYGEWDRARDIFRALTIVHPEPRTWLKWARFEEEHGTSDLVRQVFGTAVEALGDEGIDERLFVAYARFEAKRAEYERARAIYRYALDRLPRSRSMALHKAYTTFEKQYGDEDGIVDVVLAKRRAHYEERLRQDPHDYDSWIDYVRLEESSGDLDRTRDAYERAIAQVPTDSREKRDWRRYIYIWLFYAIWEETEAGSIDRARQVYQACISLIPHSHFTFAKLWLQAARFEVRHGQLQLARRLLGRAIGQCPKDKLFREYVELEHGLFEFARCRILHEKHIEWDPANCQAWIKYAHLELAFDDLDRVRAIFELAIAQPVLDMPELLWKEYIDFEEEESEYDRTRSLYERLLEKTNHVKVWISYARFEASVPGQEEAEDEESQDKARDNDDDDEEEVGTVTEAAKARARRIFQRAHDIMRDRELKEERASILDKWLEFETSHGGADGVAKVQRQMPRRTKRRQRLDDGTYEERIDWVFPADDHQAEKMSSLLVMAQQWKQQSAGGSGSGSG